MAHGHGPQPLKHEPAFDLFYRYRQTQSDRFRVTPKNLAPILVLMIGIPSALTWVAYNSQGKWFRFEKRRTTPAFEREYKP
ncbi:uncharacterized protein CYBJADRAFT_168514 [Cyberlindnera jadinii NRRL Y-1542]|uniref:NADH-ubiquinone oxidoreductase B15 subunit n=1 Tax=Cyberlindnera jadinii (strain ATCC 18201 / CBS 1600 / BCRC 20928 / JCM 3617 / NBRC 0987 / NRRL Y-1542) TaxID=983966 RepID=A0A1E4RZC2_CYBJN|nr:hypothetical protein CYBJADRAFT_168514 [Cyberlindnera jadinii NRRL Y-1542]ODV72594.1 hypothetical protein CYBJADRAFT_168514 [Cyberlindnera jadinii NRRL Y-1542]